MNKVILTGRFTRDPEIKYTNDGTSIARFSIAVNRRFVKEGSDQKADFLNCIAFGKSAEFIEKYFSKGMKADLSGRIKTGSYTNRDGQKVYTTDIVEDGKRGAINMSDKLTPDITPQLAVSAFTVLHQYCSSISPHDCIRCAFYEHCPECFMGCPGDQGEIIRKLQSNE